MPEAKCQYPETKLQKWAMTQKERKREMKKMKKILAMVMAMAMVLGMSLTTFAANGEAKIKVTNIATPDTDKGIGNAQIKYTKVITPDPDKETGWTFVKDAYAQAYIAAYNTSTAKEPDQAAIEALIAETGENNLTTTGATARLAISKASAAVLAEDWKEGAKDVSTPVAEWEVTNEGPGIYIIRIEQTRYNYLAMAAYVGFGKVVETSNGYEYPIMYNAELVTKGGPLVVEKESGDQNGVVAVGDTITYTIKTTVPYIESENLRTETYAVQDTITGAEYFELDKATIMYTNGTEETSDDTSVTGVSIAQGTGEAENTFILDLTSLLNVENSNAGKEILITYTAKVTAIDNIKNEAKAGHKNNDVVNADYGEDDDEVFTGEITVTKRGEIPAASNELPNPTDEDRPYLPGAGFKVRTFEDGDALKFTPVFVEGSNTEVDYYKYDPNGSVDVVTTAGELGVAKIKGLDIGIYYFEEVVAPEGYSINTKQVSGEVKLGEGVTKVTEATQITFVGASMNDTKINSLPSTGGIGTTIFTIGGCTIMVVAAGLFFATRKKSTK